jgi:hypothetical protein
VAINGCHHHYVVLPNKNKNKGLLLRIHFVTRPIRENPIEQERQRQIDRLIDIVGEGRVVASVYCHWNLINYLTLSTSNHHDSARFDTPILS